MVALIPNSPQRGSRKFQKVVDAFLGGPGLPFAEILSAGRIERIFARHDCLFGRHGVYSTAIMLWSFLSQVLRDGKEASCRSAVARVVSYREQAGLSSPTQDTGDYCRARAKLSEAALHELSGEVAEELEQATDENRRELAVEGQTPCEADRRLYVDDARHTTKPSQVSAAQNADAWCGAADRSCGGHCFVGDRLCDGSGDGAVQGQTDGRVGLVTIDAGKPCRGRHRRDGSLLLLVYDDRVVALARHADLRAKTSSATLELSPWSAAGQVRSHHHLDAAETSDVDG